MLCSLVRYDRDMSLPSACPPFGRGKPPLRSSVGAIVRNGRFRGQRWKPIAKIGALRERIGGAAGDRNWRRAEALGAVPANEDTPLPGMTKDGDAASERVDG